MTDSFNAQSTQPDEASVRKQEVEQALANARDELNRAHYRLETIDTALERAQVELDKLASGGLTGFLNALAGNLVDRVEARRTGVEALQQDHEACAQSIASLAGEVERWTAELEALGGLIEPEPTDTAESPPTRTEFDRADVVRALEAGQTLLISLSSLSSSCKRLMRRSSMGVRLGALLGTASHVMRTNMARELIRQLNQPLQYFCNCLDQLPPGNEQLAEVFVLRSNLDHFTGLARSSPDIKFDDWTNLEISTRAIVTELEALLVALPGDEQPMACAPVDESNP